MSAGAPHDPDQDPIRYPAWIERNKSTLRRIAIGMSVSSGLLVVAAASMTIRQERSFDEARCRFEVLEARSIGSDIVVADEGRACVDGVVEHRWMLKRQGAEALELGRRRLDAERFAAPRYRWREFVEHERVRVHVEIDGTAPVTYREEVAQTGKVSLPSSR